MIVKKKGGENRRWKSGEETTTISVSRFVVPVCVLTYRSRRTRKAKKVYLFFYLLHVYDAMGCCVYLHVDGCKKRKEDAYMVCDPCREGGGG